MLITNLEDSYKLAERTWVADAINKMSTGVSYLTDNGTSAVTLTIDTNTSGIKGYKTSKEELGFRAVKQFSPYANSTLPERGNVLTTCGIFQHDILFTYLTEDGLLDNNPDKFPQGKIKDAWLERDNVYVLTEENELYEYNASGWLYIVNYDVKKLLLPSAGDVYMVTRDGQLYYKGSAVSGVTDAHEDFTQIYPECVFHDIAFDAGTLMVLKG